jgi:hypothetical protein
MIKINKGVAGPKTFAEKLAGDNSPWLGQEHDQDLERLFGKLQTQAVFAELSRLYIDFKRAEAHVPRRADALFHKESGDEREYSARARERQRQLWISGDKPWLFNDKVKDAEMLSIGRIADCVISGLRADSHD